MRTREFRSSIRRNFKNSAQNLFRQFLKLFNEGWNETFAAIKIDQETEKKARGCESFLTKKFKDMGFDFSIFCGEIHLEIPYEEQKKMTK